jgi:prolyl 4-hydroxylase
VTDTPMKEFPHFATLADCRTVIAAYDLSCKTVAERGGHPFWEGRVLGLHSLIYGTDDARGILQSWRQSATCAAVSCAARILFSDSVMVVRWEGQDMPPHRDHRNADGTPNDTPWREWAGVIYLNDEFDGGRLIFPELNIAYKPAAGSLVVFPATALHSVERAVGAPRYTAALWFTSDSAHVDALASEDFRLGSVKKFAGTAFDANAPQAKTEKTPAPAERRTPGKLPKIDCSGNFIDTPDRRVGVLVVLKDPSVVVLENVLSDEECDELIACAAARLTRSSVIGDAEGGIGANETRTSSGMTLRLRENEIVRRVDERLAALVDWPTDWSEGLQVLRYERTQEYRPHCDWFDPEMKGLEKYLSYGGQRLSTFIMYLSDVERGGATVFPKVGLEIRPKKGGAVFFMNVDHDKVPIHQTLHAGSPVLKGVKYIASKWLRESAV